MWYLKVHWHHDFADEPVVLYSEVGDDGYEVRKVDVFRDGRLGYADKSRSTGDTVLGEKPILGVDEIAAQDEFSPSVIEAHEFEHVWRRAVTIG
ncbi:MAG: DUF6881 domain-containing protein [Mycobacteriales bacterium]|jgi:hypothetical protein